MNDLGDGSVWGEFVEDTHFVPTLLLWTNVTGMGSMLAFWLSGSMDTGRRLPRDEASQEVLNRTMVLTLDTQRI
jgi:hypothetical protein